jgi:glycosyltransferase involved in cell wall biosynthesis
MEPEVSVIIPYYRGPKWLPLSLSSVLRQEGVTLETIVVDDGSEVPPDGIIGGFTDPRVRLLRVPHGGKGAAVNAGARAARGSLICILDQDDEMLPGRLQMQAAALRGNPEIDAVYSDYERRDENGGLIDVFRSRQASRQEMLHCLATSTGLFSIQTLLMRKRTFDKVGGLCPDDRITGFDDAEFFVRLLVSGSTLQHVPSVFARWISHSSNYSKSARFHEARLFWIERLTFLAAEHEILKRELPFFKAHNYFMRGIFFLGENDPKKAVPEFAKALKADWLNVNSYYLLGKSVVWGVVSSLFKHRRPHK